MLVKKAIENLEKRKEFLEWRKQHKDDFLVHVMIMIEPEVDHKFDIGYYSEKENLMTTFLVDKEVTSVEVNPDQKIFKDPEHRIKALEKGKIVIGYEVALELASDCQKEKYKGQEPMKEVVILQNIKEGQVWNITYVTRTFKTLNIKVSAEKPEIISDKLVELFDIQK